MEKRLAGKEDLALLAQYGLQDADVKHPVLLKFRQGEYVLREGHAIDSLYFVLSGKAKVCLHSSSGKQLLLCYFISSGILGDLEMLMEEQDAFATVQAVSDFECIVVPFSKNPHLLNHNIFAQGLARELAGKLKQRDTYSATTMLYTLEERLCAYIVQTNCNGIFRETLTDVAGLLGSSYRHLLRCLQKLCNDGVLKKQNNGFQIVNQKMLQERAGDLYV